MVRAVDSRAYDVVTDDPGVVEQLRDRFHDVEDLPDDALALDEPIRS